jgi:hypothetical protein
VCLALSGFSCILHRAVPPTRDAGGCVYRYQIMAAAGVDQPDDGAAAEQVCPVPPSQMTCICVPRVGRLDVAESRRERLCSHVEMVGGCFPVQRDLAEAIAASTADPEFVPQQRADSLSSRGAPCYGVVCVV